MCRRRTEQPREHARIRLAERLEAKRRALGATFDQVAQHLDWNRASLFRYVRGVWRMKPGH